MKRGEAVEASWAAMIAEYPPLPQSEELSGVDSAGDETTTAESILARTSRSEPCVANVVNWVYAVLERDEVTPDEFPSLGAWNLWRWALENQTRFFEHLLPRALAAKQSDETTDAGQREERRAIEELEREVDRMRRRQRAALASDLANDRAGTVSRFSAENLRL